MTEETVTNGADAAPQETGNVELNLNDLSSMRNLIEVVTQRGAFKATELSSVGILYDRLNKFLSSIPAANAQAPSTEPAQGE